MKSHSEERLAYLAGFVDGEGCFTFYRSTPEVSVSNTYLPILHLLEDEFGGRVSSHGHSKGRPAHRWRVSGDKALIVCIALSRFLIEKKPQAELLIKMRNAGPGPERDEMRETLKRFKRPEFASTQQ